MAWQKPPPGLIDMATAENRSGYSRQTIAPAARRGDIPGARQRVKNGRWFFTPEGLDEWAGVKSKVAAVS
jgi:hypothetical protein